MKVSRHRKQNSEVMGISLVRWIKKAWIYIPLVGEQTNAMLLHTKTEIEESDCQVSLDEI